jgi:hypothetical protein
MRASLVARLADRRFLTGVLAGALIVVVIGGLARLVRDDGSGQAQASERRNQQQEKAVPTPTVVAPTGADTPVPTVTPSEDSGGDNAEETDGSGEPTAPATATERLESLPSGTKVTCPAATREVSDAKGLQEALSAAQPGDVISLADGTYSGKFVASASGTADKPIFLCGAEGAVLDGGSITGGYVLHLNGANYWRLVGFSVRNGQKGVVADGVAGSVIQTLTVSEIGDEAIHLRSGSTGNAVLGNKVSRTGLRRDKFGEGVYVGSAVSNWGTYSGGKPDRSDYNLVQGNNISRTGAESVDVKEGTVGGAVIGNTFDGTGMTGGDSWVDIKGNDWLIKGNVGRNTPKDGYQTHHITGDWGSNNVFTDNVAEMSGDGDGYYIHDPESTGNTVTCNNKGGDGSALKTNVTCSG